ncbi:MAG TPA: CapA family protein [Candidatus Babeliaceae bacterium]|nr:CapA family protein [Candidatus Babeliaceae bacterium]
MVFSRVLFLYALLFSLTPFNGQAKGNSVSIGLAGDVMLGRLVNDTIATTSYAYPWGNLLPELYKNDLNIINLETTLTNAKKPVPKVFNFRANPEVVVSLLLGNITVVNTANNHILDFGIPGLIETLKVLDSTGIKHVGSGNNELQARRPVIINKNNIKIGIIGATDNEPTWIATSIRPGTNYFSATKANRLLQDVRALRPLVDILIVCLHWGPNMKERPSHEFRDLAHQLIDSGVDILHGHSAHIFQGIEIYKNKLILYDTGDFVDDYAVDPFLRNDRSFLFNVTVDEQGLRQLKLIPVIIKDMQVRKAQGKQAAQIIRRMQALSQEFHTKIESDGTLVLTNTSGH